MASSDFGNKLQEARSRAGLSQADVALALGVSQSYVSRVESGSENVTLLTCERFARVVGCIYLSMLQPISSAGAGKFTHFSRYNA